MSAKADQLGAARSILAVRLDTIGDVVMTTPALAALKASGARVTLLTSSVSRSLDGLLPSVDELIALDVAWMKPAERQLEPAETHLAQVGDLRARGFDAAVIFTVSTQDPACAAYLCYLAGIPRVSCHVNDKLYGLVTDPVPDTDGWPPQRHEVDRQLDLVRALGFDPVTTRLGVEVPPPSRNVRALLAHVGGSFCVVHPGATAPSRRYPNAQWSRAIDVLHSSGIRVVLAGGKQDRDRCAEIYRGCAIKPVRADGRLSLPELTAVLAKAEAAATCNSSAAHLCAAIGTPVTTLYAGTNPQHTPWSPNARVLRLETPCTWCLSSVCRRGVPACIARIEPEQVAASVLEQLGDSAGRRADKRGPRRLTWRTGVTPPA